MTGDIEKAPDGDIESAAPEVLVLTQLHIGVIEAVKMRDCTTINDVLTDQRAFGTYAVMNAIEKLDRAGYINIVNGRELQAIDRPYMRHLERQFGRLLPTSLMITEEQAYQVTMLEEMLGRSAPRRDLREEEKRKELENLVKEAEKAGIKRGGKRKWWRRLFRR